MQIIKEIINNPEKRSQLTIFQFKIILLICLTNFTSLLFTRTIQIQHSCHPLIHWSGEFPAECQVAAKYDCLSQIKEKSKTLKQKPQIAQNIPDSSKVIEPKIPINNLKSESQTQSNPVSRLIDEHPKDVLGATAGIGVGIATAAAATTVLSMPVAGAVLIGLGVWYVIKTIF